MAKAILRPILASLALAATLQAQTAAPRDDEFARRQYESGLSFLQNRQFAEALKDFQSVVESFPRSPVADDALMQIAMYQFDVAHDMAAAQTANEKLLKDYPDSDSAPMGYVIGGRLTIAKGHAPADVDAALAAFDRVPRLFPGSDAVPAATFYAGDTLRQMRRVEEALARFRRVATEYPRSIWAARANLAAGMCLVQTDRAARALDGLQHVRQQFPGSVEGIAALNLNTIIYRLYLRAPAQPAYTFSGRYVGTEAAKFRDVYAVSSDDAGRILLGHNKGVSIFDNKAALVKTVAAEDASAFFEDEGGRVVVARRDILVGEGSQMTSIAVPAAAAGGKGRAVEDIPSVVVMSNGDRLVADKKGKVVIRISSMGKYIGTFATANPERLAINRMDDVAIIDKDAKAIVIVDRDGKALSKLPMKGTGYELDNPVDLAFDALGHLYVLDRGKPSVLIFGMKNKLMATLAVPEKDPGGIQKPQALALDAAGRLYVFDERSQRIQVYQ